MKACGGGQPVCLTVTSLPVSGLEFDRWLNGCGPPLYEPDLSAGGALTQPVQDLCELWRSREAPDLTAVSAFDLSAWSTFQIVLFLDRMLDLSPLHHGTLTTLLTLSGGCAGTSSLSCPVVSNVRAHLTASPSVRPLQT